MTIRNVAPFFLIPLALAVAIRADDKHNPGNTAMKYPVLEQFKQLAGEWEGTESTAEGQKVRAKYKVTAGGSAVVETLFPDTDHEMVTMIHPDGEALMLTHYCMLGNQPQMRCHVKGDGKEVAFKFIRATNLHSDKDMHMHDVTYTFVDSDTLKTEWVNFKDGKPGEKVKFDLKRKK